MAKMKLVSVYLLITVLFTHKSYGNQITAEELYGVSRPLIFLGNKNRIFDCTGVTGTFCSDDVADCANLFMCIAPGMSPIKVECPERETCNEGKCSAIISPLCEYRGLQFICTTEGMYPEPSSCKKYNYCVPDIATPFQGTCPNGWGYNPANTFCDKKLTNNNCAEIDRVVPQCKEAGQNEALWANPVLFYICMPHPDDVSVLYPLILKCPNDQIYIGNLECR